MAHYLKLYFYFVSFPSFLMYTQYIRYGRVDDPGEPRMRNALIGV